MSAIVVYISGHGFGHASRQVEILNALGRLGPAGAHRLIIRSSVDPSLLARTMRVPYELRPGECDSGIIQTTSLVHDMPATIAEAQRFYRTFDERIAGDARALQDDRVSLVIGDIPPLAFEVAARLGVPGIAIGNFTWDWVYAADVELCRHLPELVPRLRAAYAKATRALRLPFSHTFTVFSRVDDLPLVARRASHPRTETRTHFGIPADRPVALLSFGGYGLPSLDASTADCLEQWHILTTDRSTAAASHPAVHQIAETEFLSGAFRYEDLVAASDVVITKPGYGIIAECCANGSAMLYTSRGHFREYDLLVEEMPKYLRCRFLPQGDLFGGRWREALEAVRRLPPPPRRLEPSGADVAAAILTGELAASA